MPAYAELDGVSCTGSGAYFSLDAGPVPSRGVFYVSDHGLENIKLDPKQGHTLVFHDGVGGKFRLEHIFIESVENAQEGEVRLNLIDSRCQWAHRTYSGILNLTYDDNETYNTQTINGTTPFTVEEIVEKYVDRLKTAEGGSVSPPRTTLSSRLSEASVVIKNINWQFAPAAQCTQGALNVVGGVLSIDPDASIRVSMPGDDDFSSKSFPGTLSESTSAENNQSILKPKKIRINYKILREKRFGNEYWEAVMPWPRRDENGNILSGSTKGRPGEWDTVANILDLAFDTPFTEREILNNYLNLTTYLEEKMHTDDEDRKATEKYIKKHFYKYFRLKAPLTTSTESREQILPLHATTATFSRKDNDEKHFASAYVDDVSVVTAVESKAKDGDNSKAVCNAKIDPFSAEIIDQNQGIISFAGRGLPVCELRKDAHRNDGKLIEDHFLAKPTMQIVVAFFKKFQSSTGLWEDYYQPNDGYEDTVTDIENNGQTLDILAEDIYYIEQDLDGSGYTALNQDDIDSFSSDYAEDYFWGFIDGTSRDVVLAKIPPEITHLDAGLRSIALSCDSSGGCTMALRFHNQKPLNIFNKNYIEAADAHGGVGQTIRASGLMRSRPSREIPFQSGGAFSQKFEDIKFVGVMEHCTDYGKRMGYVEAQTPPSWLSCNLGGTAAGEDVPEAKGDSENNRRMDFVRVYNEESDGRASYTYRAKPDVYYHHEKKVWESRMVAQPIKTESGKPTAAQNPNRGVVNVTAGGKSSADAAGTRYAPDKPSKAQTENKAKGAASEEDDEGGNTSTFVWDKSSEYKKCLKGPLNNVFMLDPNRKCGEDPEGNT